MRLIFEFNLLTSPAAKAINQELVKVIEKFSSDLSLNAGNRQFYSPNNSGFEIDENMGKIKVLNKRKV